MEDCNAPSSNVTNQNTQEMVDHLQAEGFLRRLFDPLVFIPVTLTPEQETTLEEKNGPMLSRHERMRQYRQRNPDRVKKPRTPYPYEEQYKDDPPYHFKDFLEPLQIVIK